MWKTLSGVRKNGKTMPQLLPYIKELKGYVDNSSLKKNLKDTKKRLFHLGINFENYMPYFISHYNQTHFLYLESTYYGLLITVNLRSASVKSRTYFQYFKCQSLLCRKNSAQENCWKTYYKGLNLKNKVKWEESTLCQINQPFTPWLLERTTHWVL